MKRGAKVFIVIAFCVFIFTTFAKVMNYIFVKPSIGDYEINRINKTVAVTENNVYSVTESFDIDFKGAATELLYPIRTMERGNEILVKDINVVSTGNTMFSYKVKKSKDTIYIAFYNNGKTGRDLVSFSYYLDKGEDFDPDKDYFAIELFNPDVCKEIKELQYTVKFDRNINPDNIHFYTSIENKVDFNVTVNGNTLAGKYIGTRNLTEEATLLVDLDEGFFIHERNSKISDIIMRIVYLIITVVFGLVWFFKGKDDEIAANPVFTAPDGMNPLEVGYWIDGSVQYNDMFYFLLEWANEGYIRIEKQSLKDATNGKINFIFRRLRPLDINKPDYEKKLFDAFFVLGDEETSAGEFSTKVFRTETDALYGTLQTYAQDVAEAEEMFNKHVGKEENEGFDLSAEKLFKFMKCASMFLWVFAIYYYSFGNLVTFLDYLPIFTVLITVALALFVPKDSFFNYIIFASPLLLLISLSTIDMTVLFLIIACLFITAFVRKRTFKYNDLLGKIYGFRNVISKSKYKNEINELAKSAPNYFYDMLPYAFVLYKEEHWLKQFDYIDNPDWFVSMDGEEMNKENCLDFLKAFRELGYEILMIVNNSVDADKKKESREGLNYVSKSDRIKNAGLDVTDFDDMN